MMRAGLIKKLGAGIYNYMPMGLRVIRKVEAIVREEMNKAGAVELTMPVVQPSELVARDWAALKKWALSYCASKTATAATLSCSLRAKKSSPTSPAKKLRSYKQLPKNFYQIQTKFRDERRPSFWFDARVASSP